MSRLGREWERREEQRQQLLKQKVQCSWSHQMEKNCPRSHLCSQLERYSELEQQLQKSLREVQQQQQQIKQKEAEVRREMVGEGEGK